MKKERNKLKYEIVLAGLLNSNDDHIIDMQPELTLIAGNKSSITSISKNAVIF